MSLGKRVYGVETEYGCLLRDDNLDGIEHVVDCVKNHIFYHCKLGAIDVLARNEAFEPSRAGGFLLNGGRLYVDAVGSHQEYATPECSSLRDLIAYDRAGHLLLLRALQELGWEDRVSFYANSVDHFGGHTFGCHENYLVTMGEDFFGEPLQSLFPFLVTRQIFAGVGRVGGHILDRTRVVLDPRTVMENPIDYVWVPNVYNVLPDDSVQYQLSQRADHIIRAAATRVRFNRAIVNPKWDDFYSFNTMGRLHLLFGEANMSEYAYALKIGTTSLVLDLIEDDAVPEGLGFDTESACIRALHTVSRDATWKWLVELGNGTVIGAVDLQRMYLAAAQSLYRGRDPETDWVLTEWESTLDGLEKDPMSLGDRLDWVAKRQVLEAFMADAGVGWEDDSLHSVDMEYHNIDPRNGLYHYLQSSGKMRRLCSDLQILDAVTEPPEGTRARGRGMVVREIVARRVHRYWIDWDMVAVDGGKQLAFRDPLKTYHREAETFISYLPNRRGKA
ncbi:MAG: hypothetical protein AMXMBFR61_25650 [Fimbriimonadales bacterium]